MAIIDIKTFADSIQFVDTAPEINLWIEEFLESSERIQSSFDSYQEKGLLTQIKRFENLSKERLAKTGICMQAELRQLKELTIRMQTQLDR